MNDTAILICTGQAAACIEHVCEYREWETDFIPTLCFEQLISMLTASQVFRPSVLPSSSRLAAALLSADDSSQVVALDSRRKCTLPKKTIQKDLQLREKICHVTPDSNSSLLPTARTAAVLSCQVAGGAPSVNRSQAAASGNCSGCRLSTSGE